MPATLRLSSTCARKYLHALVCSRESLHGYFTVAALQHFSVVRLQVLRPFHEDSAALQAAVDHLVEIGFLSRRDVLRAGGVNMLWGLLLQVRQGSNWQQRPCQRLCCCLLKPSRLNPAGRQCCSGGRQRRHTLDAWRAGC